MIRHIARPLLGSIFVYSGYHALVHPKPIAQAAEPMIDAAADATRSISTRSVSEPQNAKLSTDMNKETLARVYGGVQLGAGLMLATSRFPRPTSLILAGSLIPATATHSFWNEDDPAARQDQTIHFLKNLSVMGGLLIAGFDTEGKPGVMWRTRRAAERLQDRATAHVPGLHSEHDGTAHYTDTVKNVAAQAADRIDGATTIAGEKLSDAALRAKPVLAKTAADASQTAAEIGSTVGSKVSTVGSKVGKNIRELQAEALQTDAPQLATDAAETARKTARSARRKAAKLRNKAEKTLRDR